MTLSDLGISTTISNKIAPLIESRSFAELNTIYSTGLILLSLLSSLLMLIVLLTLYLFQRDQFHEFKNIELLLAFLLSFVYITLLVHLNFQNCIYIANFQYSKQKNFDTIIKTAELLSIFLCLYFGGKAVSVIVSLLFIRFIHCFVILRDSREKLPWLDFKLSKFSKQTAVQLLSPSLANMTLNLGSLLYYQGMSLTVANLFGPILLAQYHALTTILRGVKQIPLILNQPLYPEYSTLIATNAFKEARNLYKLTLSITMPLVLLSLISISFFYKSLVSIILNSTFDSERFTQFFVLTSIGIFFQCLWHSSSVVIVAVNQHILLAKQYILACLVAYLIIYFTSSFYGLTSIGIALLTIDVILLFVTFSQSLKILNENIITLFSFNFPTILNKTNGIK